MAPPKAVDMIRFEHRHAKDFKRWNLEWLERFFQIEPIDTKMLSEPQTVIASGGAIFLAQTRTAIKGLASAAGYWSRSPPTEPPYARSDLYLLYQKE